MDEILFPYLAAMVITAAVLTIGAFAYLRFQRAANDHMIKSQRLPDFIQWTDLREKVVELQDRYESLRQQESDALGAIEAARVAQDFLEANKTAIEETRLAVAQREKEESQLVTTREDLALRIEELRKIKQEYNKAKFECDLLAKAVEVLHKDQEKLEAEEKRLKAGNEELETRRREKLEEAERLQTQNATLKAEVAGLEARKNTLLEEVRELETRETKARTEAAALEAKVKQLTTKKAGLEVEVGPVVAKSVEDRASELCEAVFSLDTLPEPAEDLTEKSALDSVARHLEAHELRFHPRVINAFHTALKVQGDSPLLVLAGISGTGKSLLPQRYAEALGIHCHVVPVQPRWDGPQDLLGFYHHLEGRFKSTPLTRAMIQFDRFSTLSRKNTDLSKRMLMVLLDEMNLARIEYYFSEFLSRLETRRDVDLEDPEQRRRCAIPLEVGSVDGEGSTLDLVVDHNVLFVGTINEDESTQTLSDKVVDRANVMRFGRPKHLARPGAGAASVATGAKHHLPRAVWESWSQNAPPLTEPGHRTVEEITKRLNDALEEIGKAFGHRTYRAMLAYVGQYPLLSSDSTDDPQRINWAIADQIEQRILPKLRGLDPTDGAEGTAIDEVHRVVEDLGDDVLAEAIDKARQGHSFLWQGVERTR